MDASLGFPRNDACRMTVETNDMARTFSRLDVKTILSPGQRFQSADHRTAELTVSRLVTDRLGLLHVTLRSEDGREISAFAEQVEAAIAEGHLTPVSMAPAMTASLSAC
jgi:hypothetical protein